MEGPSVRDDEEEPDPEIIFKVVHEAPPENRMIPGGGTFATHTD
jgi:hypothetical protein